MASLEEAFKGQYGKGKLPKAEMQVHSSQKVYNTPSRRTEAALKAHEETIRDLTKSLPIASNDEEMVNNYSPADVVGPPKTNTNQIEPFSVNEYVPPALPATHDFAYSSPIPPMNTALGWDRKIDRIMKKLDVAEETSTHDLILYIFTGVFFLFVLDTFVTLGRRSR
ncbi:MAG: hypothetical protein EBU01_07720 [Crocinitomicaceae bacterium]|nr:hypothetical protein [Crocinitomicaceae bacterium]